MCSYLKGSLIKNHRDRGSPEKTLKYEFIFNWFTWAVIILGTIYFALYVVINGKEFSCNRDKALLLAFFPILLILNGLKSILIHKRLYDIHLLYLVARAIEIYVISIALALMPLAKWAFLFLVYQIIITSLTKGKKTGLLLLTFSFKIFTLSLLLSKIAAGKAVNFFSEIISFEYLHILFQYIILACFVVLSGNIYIDLSISRDQKKRLLKKVKEKYHQLRVAQDEIKFNYKNLSEANARLIQSNKKLASAVAEFYTLQQISQAINSIFDIQELLKCVNDIILGVMGTNSSTILFYDEKRVSLRLHTTNLNDCDEIILFSKRVNCDVLLMCFLAANHLLKTTLILKSIHLLRKEE
ncbi:MAG: hypothetical protein ACOX7R_12150 [Acetivibrionales bacterium]